MPVPALPVPQHDAAGCRSAAAVQLVVHCNCQQQRHQSSIYLPGPGSYTPALTVKADTSSPPPAKSRSKTLQVYAEPVMELTHSCQALSCSLNAAASSANGAISSVQWTVNNQTLSGNSVSVTFSAAGSYTVVALATDSAGQQVQKTINISVTAPVVVTPAEPAASQSSGGSLRPDSAELIGCGAAGNAGAEPLADIHLMLFRTPDGYFFCFVVVPVKPETYRPGSVGCRDSPDTGHNVVVSGIPIAARFLRLPPTP